MRWYHTFTIWPILTLIGILIPTTEDACAADTAETPPVAVDNRHISLRPYRLRIELAFASDSRLDAFERQRMMTRLPQIIERSAGQKWALTPSQPGEQTAGIYGNNWLSLSTLTGLRRVSTTDLLQRYPEPAFDKLFLLTVESAGIGYRISGREFDVASHRLSPPAEKTTYAKTFLADTGFQLLGSLFSAVVNIEDVQEDQVTVSEQASQYLTPDPAIGTLQKNDYFVPFFRYLNRNREVKDIQMIPWTYLVLQDVNRKYASCSLSSALRGILSSSRRRVEMEAIQVKPRYGQTRLSLIPRGTSTQTYAGMRVQISPLDPQQVRQLQIAAKKESEKTGKKVVVDQDYITAELLTSRQGTIQLPADPQHPLIWLYVRSGQALVANVPYIPGIELQTEIQVPDDRIRLGVEGELAILNGELIEEVAALSMEMSRIRSWAKNMEWDKVAAGIRELESGISPREVFQDKLNVIRVSATEEAQQQKNRSAQSRIASLCRETQDRIDRFLDPSGIVDFKTEIQDLKQLQQETP